MPDEPNDETVEPTFEEMLAWSMDAEVELLPFLPEVFQDLEELGARTTEVLQVLSQVELPESPRMLDLGCGKGAVSLALVQRFGGTVHGLDGMAAFISHAESQAAAKGITEQCIFAQADVRKAVLESRDYDLACLLALGDVLGSAQETVATLRECVKPGGFMLIDDAYLRDGATPPEDVVNCFDHATTNELLQSSGDTIVAELVIDGPETAAYYESMTARIAARAEALARENPADAELLLGYIERQKEEVDVLLGPIVGAMWLIRRGG